MCTNQAQMSTSDDHPAFRAGSMLPVCQARMCQK